MSEIFQLSILIALYFALLSAMSTSSHERIKKIEKKFEENRNEKN